MEVSAAASLSLVLPMFLVVWSGTAWFIALHPHFIWKILQGAELSDEPPDAYCRMLRMGGIVFGAAGLLLLFSSELIR